MVSESAVATTRLESDLKYNELKWLMGKMKVEEPSIILKLLNIHLVFLDIMLKGASPNLKIIFFVSVVEQLNGFRIFLGF